MLVSELMAMPAREICRCNPCLMQNCTQRRSFHKYAPTSLSAGAELDTVPTGKTLQQLNTITASGRNHRVATYSVQSTV